MIAIIAAVGQNYELGKKGDLCWRIKADLQRFKRLTTKHTVVMGYNTYKSLGFKPLPNRKNYVVTKCPLDKETSKGVIEIPEDKLLDSLTGWSKAKEEIFIIGGGALYKKCISWADKIYLTKIKKTDPEADTFFPTKKDWGLGWEEEVEEDHNECAYLTYTKKEKE